MGDKLLLDERELDIILRRLACQLIENHDNFHDSVLLGLQPRGSYLARRLAALIHQDYQKEHLKLGLLDITFFRDDFRRSKQPLAANTTDISFVVEDKKVIIVDDVLYTGRSINSALTALQSFGRPSSVELLVLIDRRFSRHLPIQPDYKGRQVDAIDQQKVRVCWKEKDDIDAVYLTKNEEENE
jgi:pyrimidine operon attenuation protein/uracil phosphoribosyltransferase